jgi:VWFA-related protein
VIEHRRSGQTSTRRAIDAFAFLLALGPLAGGQQAKEPTPFHLEINVDRLLVPVVVRDAHARTINDLKKEDFQVFDNGKPRAVSAFAVEWRGAPAPAQTAPAPLSPAPASRDPQSPDRITVFLLDDMHLSAEDLAQAHAAGIKAVDGALAGNGMAAVVSMSSTVNTGLTRDRTKLQEAMSRLKPHSMFQPDATDCPHLDYYEAYLIETKHDPIAVQNTVQKYINCHPAFANVQDLKTSANQPNAEGLVEGSAERILAAGRQDVQMSMANIAAIIHSMAKLPGRRSLVLVSPGFLNIERESQDEESRIIDLAARSNVAVSALDARGLYVTRNDRHPAQPHAQRAQLPDKFRFPEQQPETPGKRDGRTRRWHRRQVLPQQQ